MSAEEIAPPRSAKFAVGMYSDGSGPVCEVSYDTASHHVPECIWIETSSDSWVAIPHEHVEQLAKTILSAASAVRALIEGTTHD